MHRNTSRIMKGYASSRPIVEERWLRLGAAVGLLLLHFEAMLGLEWDIQWHISVGRDRFWTPPHILLYTAVGLRGLLCAGIVLWETWRYRRGAGVDDGNSIAVAGVFHAPLGFVVAGFGALVTALAAPLDDYWHQLYGIDVALWAPFHTMGSLGGLIAGLGTVYVWAALAVQRHRTDRGASRWSLESWGVLLASMFLVGQMRTLSSPALLQTPTLHLAGMQVTLYPVLLTLGIAWLLVAANETWPLRGAASAVIGLVMVRDLVLQVFVPWAVRTGAAAEGLSFRSPALVPHFSFAPFVIDLGLLVCAVCADWLAQRGRVSDHTVRGPVLRLPALRGALLGVPLYLLGVWVACAAWSVLPQEGLPPEIPIGQPAPLTATLLALPVALAMGALSGWIGGGLGQVWRRNPR